MLQNMQNQTGTKHFSNPEGNLKSAKKILEKPNAKEDSSKTNISKVLSKISNRRKLQINVCTTFEQD